MNINYKENTRNYMNISESQICSIILTLNAVTGFRYSLTEHVIN